MRNVFGLAMKQHYADMDKIAARIAGKGLLKSQITNELIAKTAREMGLDRDGFSLEYGYIRSQINKKL